MKRFFASVILLCLSSAPLFAQTYQPNWDSVDKRPTVVGFIAALGGREIEQPMAREMFDKLSAAADGGLASGDVCHWIGVRN